jgi:hypothetical protein
MEEITIFIIVPGAPRNYNKVGKKILEQLRVQRFNNYEHTVGTNVVQIHLNDASELPDAVKKINKLKEKPFFYIFSDPISEIDRAITYHDYFKAFSLCTTLYESYGKSILKVHFKNKGITITPDEFGLQYVIIMLFAQGLIRINTYSDIISVNNIRNVLIHRNLIGQIPKPVYNRITQNIPRVLRSLIKLKEVKENISKGKP